MAPRGSLDPFISSGGIIERERVKLCHLSHLEKRRPKQFCLSAFMKLWYRATVLVIAGQELVNPGGNSIPYLPTYFRIYGL